MNELLEWITRGNVTEVKIVLASVLAALAFFQVMLMLVGYRKVSLTFLSPEAASKAHRTIGDSMVVLTIIVSLMCLSYFEIEDDNLVHAGLGSLLLILIALKVAAVRRWVSADALLPWLGSSLLILFAATWASSAAGFLVSDQ